MRWPITKAGTSISVSSSRRRLGLRIAIDPHRISGVGAELQATRSVENEDIHPFEGVRDLAHHCFGSSFIR